MFKWRFEPGRAYTWEKNVRFGGLPFDLILLLFFLFEILLYLYLQYNKNLRCPDEIIVKQNIGLDKITGIIFINEFSMIEKFEISINMKFNQSFIYGEDIYIIIDAMKLFL